jgi:outer membrane protein insertion porin family
MQKQLARTLACAALLAAVAAPPAFAQGGNPAAANSNPSTVCGSPIPPPVALPPANSGPVVYLIVPCFAKQGGSPVVEPETYLYYIQLRPSLPSQNIWVPWDDAHQQIATEDFKRLWGTNFLDDLSIEVTDYRFSNGVIGKIVLYDMEERERVKIVNYEGSKNIDRTKIAEQLKEKGIELRLDSFLDENTLHRVESVLHEMMAEKGFTNAEITHTTTPVAGGPKLVNITFNIGEGPKLRIREIEFVGNQAFSDRTLARKMKDNKSKKGLIFMTLFRSATYKEDKYEDDAEKVAAFYREKGYVRARVGNPEVKTIGDEKGGKTRWIQLRIPVTEGPRYRVGAFNFEGNTVVKSENLRPMFKVKEGDWYSEKYVRDGLKKAQEAYGAGGYMEFTGYPDLNPKNDGLAPVPTDGNAAPPAAPAATPPPASDGNANAKNESGSTALKPTVDVTMRLSEGKQFFVNRISFIGNATTRDNVIRREMRLVEGSTFNTESLKYSIRRLNQLGYFKNLEGNDKDMKVDKVAGRDNQVDVTLKVEEQNRNQVTFGAGVSQYEGFFGQLSFQTANFLGRGESLTASAQAGSRSQNYQLAFTEPFLFDRNLTGGVDVYKRSLQYIGYYTQKSTGGNLTFGFPVQDFARMFINYSYESVGVADLNEALLDPSCVVSASGCSTVNVSDLSRISPQALEQLRRNPFLFDSFLIGSKGNRTISKVSPSYVFNTIDNPIFPANGKRVTLAMDIGGLGGNTSYLKPTLEGIWYHPHTSRSSFGGRVQFQYIEPYRGTTSLPVFERLFLGGEYSVRGYDIRSIGPTVPNSQIVLGGNKSLLFNGEYIITVAGPVRLVLFYDAGQVRDFGEKFAWKEDLTRQVFPAPPLLIDPFSALSFGGLEDPNALGVHTEVIGRTSAFKTSTGAEIRFFMPVLNVPFRLIFAANPQRGGVLNNTLLPAKAFTFKFAVGSTF